MKPTGKAGNGTDQIFVAQNIEKLIFQKKNVGNNGDSSSGDENSKENDEDSDEEENIQDDEDAAEGNINLENDLFGNAMTATPVTNTASSLVGNKRRVEDSTPTLNAKTKNSRHSGGTRKGASTALTKMGDAITALGTSMNNDAIFERFERMQQQSQVQAQQFQAQLQQQMQTQNNNMMMMLVMMMSNRGGDDRANGSDMMRAITQNLQLGPPAMPPSNSSESNAGNSSSSFK